MDLTNSDGGRVGRIEKLLETRESMLWARVGLKLAVGLPLTLAVPLVLAIVLVLWWGISFWMWFFVSMAGWLWLAWRACNKADGRSVFTEAMVEEIGGDVDYASSSSPGGLKVKQGTMAFWAYLEFLMFGPREVYEAWRIFEERRQFTGTARLRAAGVVAYLGQQDHGVPWLELRQENEPVEQLLKVLGYLRFSEWIDISSDGKKVWLLSDARKALR